MSYWTDNFCHLHLHSSYSFTDGYGLPEQYIKRAKEMGQPGIGLTDHGNTFGHFKWYKGCNKEGIKPILGCEMYIVKSLEEIHEREYNHITILVKNNIGYRNLTKLVTKSSCEQFYYKPRITYKDLFDHQEGLIVLSGCLSSPIMKLIKDNRIEHAASMLREFKNNINDFYIEVQPISFDEGLEAYKRLMKLYNETLKQEGFKIVATNDCHYVKKEHAKIQEILLCIQSNDCMSNVNHWKFDQSDFYLKSRKEMEDSLNALHPGMDFKEALDASIEIMNGVDFTFPNSSSISFPMEEDKKIDYLKRMCMEGLDKKVLNNNLAGIDKAKYEERIAYEIDLIVKKKFIDYFLVIHDLVNWAKSNGILVGPGRGSAAGSLVCYSLSITEVEPIRYGLIFERFIDLNREDLPDIDLDFEDIRRHEVKKYLEDKYGKDRVGNLPTFSAFKGKSAIDDIGRVFKIPFSVLEKIKNSIIERSGGDSRASFTLEDTFNSSVFEYPKQAIKEYPELKYAIELEGQYRQSGQHAAGVVISNEPITNFCSVNKVKDSYVISTDYKDSSDIGLLKIDILGLNTLSVISKTLKEIKNRHGVEFDLYNIPLTDPKVYKGFCDGKLFGIFQFDGQAVNQVCRQIMPKDFESLSAISALARPGPLNSGSTTLYIERRIGKKRVEYSHKLLEPFTKQTYGIVIYQEQVMRVMREIGNMSWKDTAEIRKAISKSQGLEAFNRYKEKFSIGAKENGLTSKEIDTIWDSVCTFGSWAFNASHSVSYTMISYWTMFLKVYYPLEFYSSIMALTENKEKKKKILKEYKKEGNKILPVDINSSKRSFSIDKEGLRIGFSDIKGIGDKASEMMVNCQPYSSYRDFESKVMISKSIKNALANLGAFDCIRNESFSTNLFNEIVYDFKKNDIDFSEKFELCPWDMEFSIDKNWLPFIQKNIYKFKQLPVSIESLKEMDSSKEVCIYGIVYDKNLRDAREVSASKGKDIDLSKYNIVHLLNEDIIKWFKGNKYVSKWAIEQYKNKNISKVVNKGIDYEFEDQFQFANFTIEDDTDFITTRLSHVGFPQYGKIIFEEIRIGDPVFIYGKMGNGIRMFFSNRIINLRKIRDS